MFESVSCMCKNEFTPRIRNPAMNSTTGSETLHKNTGFASDKLT